MAKPPAEDGSRNLATPRKMRNMKRLLIWSVCCQNDSILGHEITLGSVSYLGTVVIEPTISEQKYMLSSAYVYMSVKPPTIL